ncbi:RING finger protein 24 [Datura stramonium]|uniref:RING-type E3 ubiquitin transferase n=1 Tax=Datura stramonium TaxID=4076 RepID=A0ABS8SQ85_DATST|nr:RING finger protein 24 [Datura stramonium]
MERSRPNADDSTFNGVLNSIPDQIPRDRSSTDRRDGSVQELRHSYFASVEGINRCSHGEFCLFCPAILSWMLSSPLGYTNALISANTSSGERTTYLLNPYTLTTTPVKLFHFSKENEAQVYMQDHNDRSRAYDRALFGLYENISLDFARFGASDPCLNISLHKYDAANSTCPDNKERCCICLEEYLDREELAKIDCGHLYHIGCIKEWNKFKNTCPLCKRRVSPMLP